MENTTTTFLKEMLDGYSMKFQEFLDVENYNMSRKVDVFHESSTLRYEIQKHLAYTYTMEDLKIIAELTKDILTGDCLFL